VARVLGMFWATASGSTSVFWPFLRFFPFSRRRSSSGIAPGAAEATGRGGAGTAPPGVALATGLGRTGVGITGRAAAGGRGDAVNDVAAWAAAGAALADSAPASPTTGR